MGNVNVRGDKMKTLIIVCFLAIAFLGCAVNDTIPNREMPRWVQHIQDNIVDVRIVDWREDGLLAWVWCDNFDMPGDCDYVAILEIVDLDKDEYSGMYIINKDNMPAGSDVCAGAYEIYNNYLEGVEENKGRQEGEI